MTKKLKIALDGPASSGKSAVSKELAKKLSYLYIDTGAMYRAVTWLALAKGVSAYDEEAMTKLASAYPIELIADDSEKGYKVIADSKDITQEITSDEVNALVSPVAAISGVRKILAGRQREMAEKGGVVMAGRDITTVVIPDAELKIYLDASLEERTRRRHKEFLSQGRSISEKEVAANLAKRDSIDSGRSDSPLTISADAHVLDTTDMSVEQVVDSIITLAEKI